METPAAAFQSVRRRAVSLSSPWTDERTEIAIKLWQAGFSASYIARNIRGAITRNAVIGKMTRLGIKTPVQPNFKPTGPRVAGRPRKRILGLPTPPVLPPIVEEPPVPVDGRPTFVDLDMASACRFPIGSPTPLQHYCGAARVWYGEGVRIQHFYCSFHAQQVHQPAKNGGR